MTGGMRLRIALISLLALLAQPALFAAGSEIPVANNLAELGQLSRLEGVPVIVFVSRDACPYCRSLRDKILMPMLAAGKFEQRAILIEVSLDRDDPLTGFENNQLTAKDFARFYRAEITPTLLFLNSEGLEISKRIVGISNLELYGFYLQKSIDEAMLAIRAGISEG
jgi:thioredoxin-related protein